MEEKRKEKSDFIKAKIKEIREKIARPCTEFETKKFISSQLFYYIYHHISNIFIFSI